MVQGRIEPTPAEQLRELRKARDRYAALADRLHHSTGPERNADARLAQEQDVRRILQAYEKSIANSVVRMSSMDGTHRDARPSLGIRTWLTIFAALVLVEGGVLLAYFHPEFFTLSFLQRIRIEIDRGAQIAALPKTAPAPRAPPTVAPIVAPRTPRPIARPQNLPPVPTPKPTAQPPAVAPKPIVQAPPQTPVPPQNPPPVAAAPVTPPTPPPVAAAPVTPPTPPFVAAAPVTPPPAPPPVAAVQPPTRLEPIAATHTPPPYPAAASRLGETGTTRMRISVSSLGTATECRVVQSSGSVRLDTAACSHVQANWRWKPATRDGQPVATGIDLTVVWNLRQAP